MPSTRPRTATRRLAFTAGFLWRGAEEVDRAQAALLLSVGDDPLLYDAWELLARPHGLLLALAGAPVASAWFPAEVTFLLGRALAEAGRTDDARAVAATPLDSPRDVRALSAYVLAFIDLHDAKFQRALRRLEDAAHGGIVGGAHS